ncbi:MAG TPA: type IV pilus twitching motility protein PilT, partial [Anaeromyxobacter sp.]|nr:type IV pilus twitching motility protein PilT [Anaeromyxobacter sp.]
MARIDPFIEKLFSQSARELRLEAGAGAVLATPRGPLPLVRQALTRQQVLGAVAEIVPDDLRQAFGQQGLTVFPYLSPDGAVEVRVDVTDGGATVTVVPRVRADASTRPTVEAPAALRANGARPSGSVAAASGSARLSAPADARLALDALLDTMLTRRASDLHLSTDCPPTFRVDGDMRAEKDYGPLSHDRLKELLWTIAPEKNREEWHARKDTDFAHETAAARFRVNVFADRKGIGAVLRQIPNEILGAEEMGVSQAVLDLCHLSKGLVLV